MPAENSVRRRPSGREFAQFGEAVVALALAAAAIRLLPFRTVVRMMGRQTRGPAPGEAIAAADVRTAVKRASRRLPLRTVCFQEGLAAHWMLRRRGLPSRVHYGLKQGESRLSAHVWVTLGGETVIGEESADPHECVAVFPAA